MRLWDHQPLLETFGQIQEIRTYYDFVSVDNDRYEINGQNRQVMLSVRELNPGGAAQSHLGQRAAGLHARPRPDARPGEPGDRAKGCRCCSSATCRRCRRSICTITEPSIYFGELSNDYVIVRTRAQEFHYPKGDDNVYTDYDGHRRRPARLVLAASCCSPRTSAPTRSC